MKRFVIIFFFLPIGLYSQTNNQNLADSIKYLTEVPYLSGSYAECGSDLFWKLVKQKKEIIPLLIEYLDDTTQLNIFVPNFGGKYTVADISYQAMNEIINDIPTFKLLGVKFDKNGCGYCSYWNFLRKDFKNRLLFKESVRKWYEDNKLYLIWGVSNQYLTCDCKGKHPNGGHYELEK